MNTMIKTQTFENSNSLIEKTDALLRTTLATPGNLMLSGGTTPYVIYNRIATAPSPVHPARRIFLSDERMEPLNSPKNNAHNLIPMLRSLQCESHLIRVNTTLPIEDAAKQFETDLIPLEQVDLGLIGIGLDGHTAGFFTKEQATPKAGPLVLHTDRPDGMRGVSVTPAFFQRVNRIIILAIGDTKRDILQTLLHAPQTIPVGIALRRHPNVELWTDISL